MNEDCCKYLVKRVELLGKIEILLKNVLQNPAFENLSKHNPYWGSGDEEEDADSLDETRLRLSFIEQQLCDIMELIYHDEEI